jgi:hypothetical protein
MDSVIRFCFLIDPEELDMDTYAKRFTEAKYILDYEKNIQASTTAKLLGHG